MSTAGEMSSGGRIGSATLKPRALLQTLRRIVREHLFSPEDEIGRGIDRAFAEFAREIRK